MSDIRVPAVRVRRPSWRDPRLVIGVLVVLSSVLLGARLVAAAGDAEPVYAAAADLPSGHVLVESDLRAVPVHFGGAAAGYLSPRRPPATGAVLMRPVGAGELVPVAAVGLPDALTRRPVALPLPTPAPVGLRPGVPVDLWSSARDGSASNAYRPPVRIAEGAEVYAVTVAGGGLGGGGSSVQVLLDEAQLRAALDALANGARLAVVPLPGGSGTPPSGGAG